MNYHTASIKFILFVILFFGIISKTSAAAGDVDPNFTAADGRVLTRIGNYGDTARKVLLQPDGKIVLIGKGTAVNVSGDFTVVRYYPDGSLDTTFDGDGKVSTTIGIQDSYSLGGALQPDGKIILVGEARGSNTTGSDFGIIRYNSDGSLDQSFGLGGKIITPFTDNSIDYATSAAIQNDGKITVAGMTNGRFAVVRYNTDGTLDPSFGSGGKVSVAVGNRGDVAYALVIQNDGKIVAAGTANSDSPQGFLYQMGLVRFNTDGSLDTTFDGDGKVLTSFGSYLTCRDIQLQEDGKILAAGGAATGSTGRLDFALLRYNTDGSLDSQFGSGGKVSTPISDNDDSAMSISIQPDRKIVLAGQTTVNSDDTNFALARYEFDGNLDSTFGAAGKVSTTVALQDSASSVAIQPDGKIIAAGSAASLATSSVFAIVRYNPNGFIDQNFGFKVAGRTNTVVRGVIDEANAVCLQADGKIVSAGRSRITNRYAFSLVRQNSDGTLDTTFGFNGTVTTKIGVGDTDSEARAVAVQSDGKIIVAGRIYNANNAQSLYYFALARYNSDGSLDPTFDEDGIKTITAPNEDNQAYALAVQPDGKIVVAGYADTIPGGGAAYDISVVRLNPDGSLDSTFDGDGMLTTNLGGSLNVAYALKLQADGKIVIGGVGLSAGVNSDFALVRYNPDGSLDSGFGSNGKVFTDIGGGADEIHSIAIQNDGKIVAAGTALINSQKDFAVARYNADGSPDMSFGIAGKLVTSIESNSADSASSVVLQNDGKIIVSGTSIIASNSNLAIVRYLSDGSLDTGFGSNGKVTTDYGIYGNTGETTTASVLQSDGKLIVVGSMRDRIAQGIANDRRDFLSVRYQTSPVIKSGKRIRIAL